MAKFGILDPKEPALEDQLLIDRVRRLENKLDTKSQELAIANDRIHSLETLAIELCRSVGVVVPERYSEVPMDFNSVTVNVTNHECGPAC